MTVVKEYLTTLNEFKSPGPDEWHPRVLKELAEELSEPLSIIFLKSWESGEVPEDWRRANVVPIFKKGKKKGTWELQASQPDINPSQNSGTDHKAVIVQASRKQCSNK